MFYFVLLTDNRSSKDSWGSLKYFGSRFAIEVWKLDSWWWTRYRIYRYLIIMLYNWNICNVINQCYFILRKREKKNYPLKVTLHVLPTPRPPATKPWLPLIYFLSICLFCTFFKWNYSICGHWWLATFT